MILPEFYYNCLKNCLSESQLLTLEILVWLLQVHKQVRLERLAACFPLPITYESRRRHLQRFLLLPSLSVPLLWFPLIKYILKTQIPLKSRVVVPLDRTQWKTNNLLMVSVIWKKRAFPLYWQFLQKAGSSNLYEQIAVIRPVIKLLKGYEVVIIGDREFRSVELAYWLKTKKVKFALRQKQDTYIRQQSDNFKLLSELGLAPGMKLFIEWAQAITIRLGCFSPAREGARCTEAHSPPFFVIIIIERIIAPQFILNKLVNKPTSF